MGAYLCIASNDVPPAVSKRVFLHVHCKYQWPRNRYLHPSIHSPTHPRHSLTMTGTRTTDTAPMMMIMIVCCDSHQPPSHAEYVSGTHGETLLPLLPRWILLLFKCRPRNHRAVAIQFEESAAAAASMASVRCDWNFNFPRPLLSSPLTPTVAPESSASTAVVSALQGSDVTVRCTVFAYPMNVNYWMKDEAKKRPGQIESGRQKVLNDP